MRLGELLALEWNSIDFHGRFIEVKQSVSMQLLTTLKNKRQRKVGMSLQLTGTLKVHHKTALRKEAIQQGRGLSRWVFAQVNGKRPSRSLLATKVFHRCLDRAG
jgi:integrase